MLRRSFLISGVLGGLTTFLPKIGFTSKQKCDEVPATTYPKSDIKSALEDIHKYYKNTTLHYLEFDEVKNVLAIKLYNHSDNNDIWSGFRWIIRTNIRPAKSNRIWITRNIKNYFKLADKIVPIWDINKLYLLIAYNWI